MIQILLYKGTRAENPDHARWLDRAICWWTGSRFSHVEFVEGVTADGRIAATWGSSPRDGVVRRTIIDLTTGRWELREHPGDHLAVYIWFQAHKGAKYAWLGVLGHVFFPLFWLARLLTPGRFYCSQAIALASGHYDPPGHKTPEDLAQASAPVATQEGP